MKGMRFVLFSGKGGVGKTTMAAASAVYFSLSGKKTLLFSTDPAHSLSDSLAQQVGERITPVKNMPNLFAVEQNPEALLNALKEEYNDELVGLLTSATYLDNEDAVGLTGLALPGLDELIGLKQIVDFIDDRDFDVYVWDTAPTGHTLRLLQMPDLVDGWVKLFAQMRWKYRNVTVIGGIPLKDETEDFLLNMKKTIKKVNRCLRDSALCRFVVVSIAELLSVNEMGRMIKALNASEISIRHLVINNLIPENTGCRFCNLRRREQQEYVEKIKNKYPAFRIAEVVQRPCEINGLTKLADLKTEVSGLFSDVK